MKKAAHNCISRLFPFAIVAGLAFPAFPASAGVNTWTTNGPAGEVILALGIDPSSPATLYAGAAIWPLGGVFKSTNGGGSWTLPSTSMTYLDVVALAIDPSTPATLYAGTDSFDYGANAFKSTDGGTNWTEMPAGAFALAIDPSTPRTLYAGTGDVFKSTDGGQSWTDLNAGLTNTWVSVLAIDPSAPRTIYAGTGNLGVFKSTNGGESWSAVNAGLTNSDVRALAIDPANSATLYAGTGDGVFKSTNGGESWSPVNAGLTHSYVYVLALAIDPANSATLYAGTSGGGVFRSTNGGGSWTAMNAGLTNLGVNALAIDPSTPTRIYAGTFDGVYDYLATSLPCASDSTTLCLSGGRFKVTTRWATRDGQSGFGQAVALAGGDAGYFTFFDPANVEVLVKVLNGCGFNSRFWTFAAGLTDVTVTLTVTDTQTGGIQTYINPVGTPFQPIQDTNAFATCP